MEKVGTNPCLKEFERTLEDLYSHVDEKLEGNGIVDLSICKTVIENGDGSNLTEACVNAELIEKADGSWEVEEMRYTKRRWDGQQWILLKEEDL